MDAMSCLSGIGSQVNFVSIPSGKMNIVSTGERY
jgi:hypothetical protein